MASLLFGEPQLATAGPARRSPQRFHRIAASLGRRAWVAETGETEIAKTARGVND
jgi:hypothetical protein